MSEFVDEARSRAARLVRMANTDDPRLRARLAEYATATAEPPVMGAHGIRTTGCPRCRHTMWQQQDTDGPLWVCASCGCVEECPDGSSRG